MCRSASGSTSLLRGIARAPPEWQIRSKPASTRGATMMDLSSSAALVPIGGAAACALLVVLGFMRALFKR